MRLFSRLCISSSIVLICSCVEPYSPSITEKDFNYLVVDGFLNSTDGLCRVTLTRTIPLSESTAAGESQAVVTLEQENGDRVELVEIVSGEYEASGLVIDPDKLYRININTYDGQQYQSDFVPVIKTPPIDSISWSQKRDGIEIYVNTHDPGNNTNYYRWDYFETWVYNSYFESSVKIVDGEIVRRTDSPEDQIFFCWKTQGSTNIIVGSSTKLEEDRISEFEILTVPWESTKIEDKYSILVKQKGITKKSYEYWLELRKNTESLGTFFDPLPVNVRGNIECTTSPQEVTIGFFSAGEVKEHRIFIKRDDYTPPDGIFPETEYDCELIFLPLGRPVPFGFEPVAEVRETVLVGHEISTGICVDCRMMIQGSSSIKPDFWD